MRVLKVFRDKYSPDKIYKPGDEFVSDDTHRINDLIKRGLIEGTNNDVPSISIPDKNTFESMTKKEIEKELQRKGIEYNSRQTKAELINLLLQGG